MPQAPGLGQETFEPNEEALIRRIVELQRKLHDISGDKTRRAQHPKHHGLVKGELVVNADLPANFRHGVFSQPGRFEVWIRFSNARGEDDTRPTTHGLAMKVTGLKQGIDQDFLLIDSPVFIIRNIAEFVALFEAQVAAKGGFPRAFFFPGLNPLGWRPKSLLRIRAAQKSIGNLLATRFFSASPYKLGPHAIKFALFPADSNGENSPAGNDKNFLGDRLSEHLATRSASFRFMVLPQTDPSTMPIEDPTVDWGSAWQPIATVELPAGQTINSKERLEMAESMVFSPWHTLEEHRPLGGINRARRHVYEALSQDRLANARAAGSRQSPP